MALLTRAERFKDARTVHNRHGKQTMDSVASATGITKSVIHALESDTEERERNVGYKTVAVLAKHYGVSTDWLLSLSDDPSPRPSVIDELGLSPKAADYLRYCSSKYVGKSEIVSRIIEHPKFDSMLANISMAIDTAPIDIKESQREYEELRKVLLSQTQDPHSPTGKRITDLLILTESVVELDTIVSILAESALDSIVLKRQEAKKFYISEAQKELQRIIEDIKS